MTQDQAILLAFKVVIIAGEAAAALWICVYTYLARWWENEIGKTVVDLAALIGLALLPSLLSLFFQFNRVTSHVAAWIDVALFARIAWVLFARTPMWIRLHSRKDGTRSYAGMRVFAAEVWRRRGRPRWRDGDTPGGGQAGTG